MNAPDLIWGTSVTEICPLCDIAGCKHIRDRRADMPAPPLSDPRVAALVEAGLPFQLDRAEIADGIPDDTLFEMTGFPELGCTDFTVGDLRRLCVALEAAKGAGE